MILMQQLTYIIKIASLQYIHLDVVDVIDVIDVLLLVC